MQITFGEFQGKDVEEVPSDYLKYLMEKAWDEDMRIAAEEEYEFRTRYKTHFYRRDM